MNSHAEKVEAPEDGTEVIPGEEDLVKLVERMVTESGDPQGFDAAEWVHWWIHAYVPALGNTPASFMGTPEGRELVTNLLKSSQSGVYM